MFRHRAPIVVVVDDDASFCKALERLLRSVGYRAQTYTSPDRFLERLPADAPGCVLLDLSLPGRSGLEVQEALNRSGRCWPVIFITGQGDVPSSVRAMKAGALDFLTKPCDETLLLAAVEHGIARDAALRTEQAERRELAGRVATLTPRERQVFSLLVTGLINKQMARRLGTSERTIKSHRGRVMEKLEVRSLAELVHLAHRLGIHGPGAPEEPVPGVPRMSPPSAAAASGRERLLVPLYSRTDPSCGSAPRSLEVV
jgi:FixJ family two-component response regulator